MLSITLNDRTLRRPEPDPVERLVAAASRGAATAQRQLYHDFYGYAMSIALHYAGRREEAEEITQDAFCKVFQRLCKAPLTGSFKAFLGRTVVNASIDLLRRRNRGLFTEELTDRHNAEGGVSRNAALDRMEEEDIYLLLQELPPAYRIVFNLHVLEGYDHNEIGKRLGISAGTSRSNLFKARARLRELTAADHDQNARRHG